MEVIEQSNVDLFKDSARRMTDYLASKGVKVNHTVALEALSKALGAQNYRTLLGVLNRPAPAPQEKDPDAWKDGDPQYCVDALYTDNNQRYSDDFGGRDALEAAVCCQVDRRADLCDVVITSVRDRRTGKIVDTGHVGDDEIGRNGVAIRRMLDTAKSIAGQDSDLPEAVAGALLYLDLAVDPAVVERINDMSPGDDVRSRREVNVTAYGLTRRVDPVDEITAVAEYVLTCADTQGWVRLDASNRKEVYHALALASWFEDELRGALFEDDSFEVLDEALPVSNLAGHPMTSVTWRALVNDEPVFKQDGKYNVAAPTSA